MKVYVLICILAISMHAAHGGDCRQGPAAATSHCGLPDELSNFQGYYACDSSVKIGKPRNKQELAELVGYFKHAKGVGIGHSWWGRQFCSGNTSDSINIVTTELPHTLDAILNTVYYNASSPPPATWPIQVDEEKKTVTVQAGVPQRILLDSLAEYTSSLAPNGYTIPAFPWYIDQTIAGAISTGTHGSSFLHGSVSSQTVRIEMALADGRLVNFTKASNPFLWHAAQISVGRLGVITEVELIIMPQDMVEREVVSMDFSEFVEALQVLQEDYNAALNGKGSKTVAQVLGDYEGTQMFWFVPTNTTTWLSYKGLEEEAEVALAELAEEKAQAIGLGPSVSVKSIERSTPLNYSKAPAASIAAGPFLDTAVAQVPVQAMGPVLLPATDPLTWNSLQYSFLAGYLTNGTYTRRDSILAENEFVNKATSDTDPYDQYEFSIPLQTIGDCMQRVHEAMYTDDLHLGFPVPPLIRFVGQEDAFISNAHGGPRIFFNIEDHQSYQTGTPNRRFDVRSLVGRHSLALKLHHNFDQPFPMRMVHKEISSQVTRYKAASSFSNSLLKGKAVVKILREECKARMHWGKAGWDKWAKCFDGSVEYGKSWCDFGCAVKTLDPHNKFATQSSVWKWQAAQNGVDVPFETCCGADGFSKGCTCAPRTDCVSKAVDMDELTPR